MSYRKKHVKNKIYKIKPKKSIFKKLWFWILLLFLITVAVVFYFILFYPGIQVKNIMISGNQKNKTQELQNIILDDARAGLVDLWNIKITSGSILLVNNDKLDKEILRKFPSIKTAETNKKYPQTLNLIITERQPIGAYCYNSGQCFLIDENGIIFEPAPSNLDNICIVRQTQENSPILIGKQAVAQNTASAIYKIQKSLKDNFQIGLKEALVASDIRLNVRTSEDWKIYFDLSADSDINLQITKLNLLLNGDISAVSRKNLYYIDLRPKDRAIICDNKTCGG